MDTKGGLRRVSLGRAPSESALHQNFPPCRLWSERTRGSAGRAKAPRVALFQQPARGRLALSEGSPREACRELWISRAEVTRARTTAELSPGGRRSSSAERTGTSAVIENSGVSGPLVSRWR